MTCALAPLLFLRINCLLCHFHDCLNHSPSEPERDHGHRLSNPYVCKRKKLRIRGISRKFLKVMQQVTIKKEVNLQSLEEVTKIFKQLKLCFWVFHSCKELIHQSCIYSCIKYYLLSVY